MATIARQLVDAIIGDFPHHKAGTRPVHTVGVGVSGHFKASECARSYSTAEHFQGQQVPVTVRFSNGAGSPVERDGWSDVRGMATRFYLANDAATDLIAMTLREFFVPTVKDFLAFCEAARQTPVARQSPWSKIADMLQLIRPSPEPIPGQAESGAAGSLAYANHHGPARSAVFDAGQIGAPVSYARATYDAVHTFVVTAPDQARRQVRFLWQPVAGVALVDPALPPVNAYLHGELRTRLRSRPVEFLLLMTIGETGDAFDDPTIPWPARRVRVTMGTLTLTKVAADQSANCEKISFNPCRLVPGIALSNDPILAARRDAYEVSREMRGGTQCPFAAGPR